MEATAKNIRTIHTGLFSDKALETIGSVLGQLSDGWGENNPRNDRYWRYSRVHQNSTGEVVIDVSLERWGRGEYANGFIDMTDNQVKEFFAKMIKKTAKMELSDTGTKDGWKRNNVNFKSDYLGHSSEEFGPVITIADAYCVYETLLGRKVEGRFPAFVKERVFGKPRTEEESAAIQKATEKKNELARAWSKTQEDLNNEEKAAVEAIRAKFKLLRDAEWKKYQAALDELKAGQIG